MSYLRVYLQRGLRELRGEHGGLRGGLAARHAGGGEGGGHGAAVHLLEVLRAGVRQVPGGEEFGIPE